MIRKFAKTQQTQIVYGGEIVAVNAKKLRNLKKIFTYKLLRYHNKQFRKNFVFFYDGNARTFRNS